MQIQNILSPKNISFRGFFKELRPEINRLELMKDTFERTPSITRKEADEIFNKMMAIDNIDDVCNVEFPEFSATKQFLDIDEIIKFHNDIAQKDGKDAISYDFYTTKRDVGRGFTIMKLPIEVSKDGKVKSEILKEIKRLLSDESKLSSWDKRRLMDLYKDFLV